MRELQTIIFNSIEADSYPVFLPSRNKVLVREAEEYMFSFCVVTD